MATNQPLEYEQMTYNAPDGAQAGRTSQEKVAFYGATPVAQRASALQQIISVSSVAGSIVSFMTFSTMPQNGVAIGGRVTAGRVSSQLFTCTFAPSGLSTADLLIVNKQVPILQAGIGNVRVSAATVTSASTEIGIQLHLICAGNSGSVTTATFVGDKYLFTALKGSGFVNSVTLSPGASVPPQNTAEFQFTVTGLATGMVVPISRATDQDNLAVVNARVVSNNVLGLTYLNSGNTALTPSSDVYQYSGLMGVAALSPMLIVGINCSQGFDPTAKVSNDGVTSMTIAVTGIRNTDIFIGGGTKEHRSGEGSGNVASQSENDRVHLLSARVSAAPLCALDFVHNVSNSGVSGMSVSDTWIMQMYRQANDAPCTLYNVAFSPNAVAPFLTGESSLTIAGLTVSTVVHVTKPSFTSGIGIVGYRVSAASVVGVTFINATAATITPPTETYIVANFQPVLGGQGHWIAQLASPLSVQSVNLTNEIRNTLAGMGIFQGS